MLRLVNLHLVEVVAQVPREVMLQTLLQVEQVEQEKLIQ
jgi:hypothetical protein